MIRLLKRLVILVSISLMAMNAEAQFRYGFRLGGCFTNASLENADNYSISNGSGFSGGIMFEYQSPKSGMAADIAVLYTRYNAMLLTPIGAKESVGKDFIEIPLHAKYKFWLSKFGNIFGPLVYTGPSIMVRTDSGKSEALAIQRIQPGWDAGIGIDIANFIQITGGYRFGIGNGAKQAPNDAKYHTNGWNVSVNMIFDF